MTTQTSRTQFGWRLLLTAILFLIAATSTYCLAIKGSPVSDRMQFFFQ